MHTRAKMQVTSVTPYGTTMEQVQFSAVCGQAPFGPEGESEDNTYARYTPQGDASLTINNPALLGAFKVGEKYYFDIVKADA